MLAVVPPAQVICRTRRGEYEYPPIVITGAGRVTSNVEPVRERPYPAEYVLWAAVSARVVPERLALTPLQVTVSTCEEVYVVPPTSMSGAVSWVAGVKVNVLPLRDPNTPPQAIDVT